MSGVVALLAVPAAQAQDYRLAYSPSLKLEIYIDDVKSNQPEDWCQPTLPLRIVSLESKDPAVLNDFLPRVGTLIEKQCTETTHLAFTLNNKEGARLAQGDALKSGEWQPVVLPDAAAGPAVPGAPADGQTPITFSLPNGCHIRTFWDAERDGSAMFIPSGDSVTCTPDGWMTDRSEVSVTPSASAAPTPLTFYRGFPLANLNPTSAALAVVSADNRQMLLSNSEKAPDSFLLLPFDPALHAWRFDGRVVLQISRKEAADPDTLKQAMGLAQAAYLPLLPQTSTALTFLLVEKVSPEMRDPAAAAYRTVN
ncbi:type VI secretion system-associated protein [Nissabacter sp. SGAir0207]|uniref:type VI secretion system-associated protein n=1 Tax=Nissabacter sp. SGAir0207 TaxID=2126321 RepID=UPI001F0E92BC|nr:type VI secretion system-associated protein [Nissabacter sp. SGAir0207]